MESLYFVIAGYRITGFSALLIILTLGFLSFGWPSVIIARRTGKPVWAALLMSVPLVNIIVIWIFSLSVWKLPSGGRTP